VHEGAIVTDVRRYLLGELPEEEAQRLEEEYFADDARFGELLAAEDDLIEQYLREGLDSADRARFESRFLATARGRQKVALASVLQHPQQPRRVAWGGILAAAAAVIVVITGAMVYRELGTLQRRIEQLERERTALRNEIANRPAAPLPIFAIILSAGERRSGQASTLVLPRDPAIVETRMLLGPNDRAANYTATLQTVEGRSLWSASSLQPRATDGRQMVVASIPSSALAPGTYVISLSVEGQTVEDYALTVRR
jgi:hypothetical protein